MVSRMANTMRTANPALRATIAGNVRAMMGRYQVTQQTLAGYMGIRRPSLSAKLNAQMDWKSDELQAIAEFFNIAAGDLMKPCSYDVGASTCMFDQVELPFGEGLIVPPTFR